MGCRVDSLGFIGFRGLGFRGAQNNGFLLVSAFEKDAQDAMTW